MVILSSEVFISEHVKTSVAYLYAEEIAVSSHHRMSGATFRNYLLIAYLNPVIIYFCIFEIKQNFTFWFQQFFWFVLRCFALHFIQCHAFQENWNVRIVKSNKMKDLQPVMNHSNIIIVYGPTWAILIKNIIIEYGLAQAILIKNIIIVYGPPWAILIKNIIIIYGPPWAILISNIIIVYGPPEAF